MDQELLHANQLTNGNCCPHCSSHKIIKYGKTKNNHRYKCKTCGKTYSSSKGTAVHHIHKRAQFRQYAQCIVDGLSIRQSAKSIGVSIPTAFRWRHLILASICADKPVHKSKSMAIGIEKTEYSEKGNKNRQSETKKNLPSKSAISFSYSNGYNIQLCNNKKTLNNHIRLHTTENAHVTVQPTRFLVSAIKRTTAQIVYSSNRILTRKLNTIRKNIQQWLTKFRGVATKYLTHYWEWLCINLNHASNKKNIIWKTHAVQL